MSGMGEILNKMIETDMNNSRWLFNLLEVLAQKGVLNMADLDYIKHHEEEQQGEQKYCDRNLCLKNEYNGIGCEDCVVMEQQGEQ